MTFKPKVLVVDDNAVIRKIATMNLGRFGIHVDIAENGEEAVDKFTTNKYDLILMDVAMPVLSGLSATEQIRKLEQPGKHVPIIGVTASETPERCLNAGMDDYILKPPDYERILRQWLPDYFETQNFG